MSTATKAGQYQDTRIDVKLVLSALWIAMLIVFAYVDIFGFFRADVLAAALDGKVASMGITIDQMFLAFTTVYILIPTLMVVLSLVLPPRVNRIVNIVVALVYAVTSSRSASARRGSTTSSGAPSKSCSSSRSSARHGFGRGLR